jgi:DNA-binding transcriptional ArsR family regulator
MANQMGFAALADPTRRTIFERVARRPISVGKLAEGLDVTRPAVSQHLKVLLHAGLVVQRREGSRFFYQVDPRGVQAMRDYLDRLRDHALAAFKLAAKQEKRPVLL